MVITDLIGTTVVHKDKGVGSVADIRDDMVTITMGFPPSAEASMVDVQRYADRAVFQHMLGDDGRMTWKIPEGTFLDRYEWSIAPDPSHMETVLREIQFGRSNVVIPTSNLYPYNPTDARALKVDMAEAHERFLYASPLSYDDHLISVAYQIINVVDWQLSWWLLRDKETFGKYTDRIEDFIDDLQLKAWSDHILPFVPDESRDRVVEALSVVASIRALQLPEIPPLQHVQDINELVEARINVHREVISGFLRGRHSQRRRSFRS